MHVKDQWKSVMDGQLKVLLMIAGMLFLHSPAFAAPLPKPTHTKFTRFRIPFTFDPASFQRMNAKEIQLHVSKDHGANWDQTQTLTPDGGKFEYQSHSDGEYWFSVKTVDGRSQVHPPAGAYETGLIVIVDTTPPILEFNLQQTPDGKVQLSWKATDLNLDPSSLRFEYLAPGSDDWEAVVVGLQSSGDSSFAVEQSGQVVVRGNVSDLAGNIAQAREQQINVGGAAGRGLKLRPRGPIAVSPTGGASMAVSRTSNSVQMPSNAPADLQVPVITPMGKLPQYSNISDSPVQDHWSNSNPPSGSGVISTAPFNTSRGTQVARRDVVPQSQIVDPPQAQKQPQNRRFVSRQRIVNTRKFQLGYALADVGPSGVGAVELFITEDNGHKWWKYGDDPDHKSPFDVEVPRDGVYGFTIRARSGAGLSQGAPTPNEPPETVIAVDSSSPVVELFPIEQGRGANINKLHIRWKVMEDQPAELPVSVEYAASLNGPWTSVNGWREDPNHTLDWTVGPSVPSQFYLRILYRDIAGNVGKAETSSPIVIDFVQPMARIVDVEVTPVPRPQE